MNFTSGWNITQDAVNTVVVEEDEEDSVRFVADLTGVSGTVYWTAPKEMLKNQVCYMP